MTNGGEVASVKLAHNNFAVYAPSLRSATLFDMVNLDPLVADLPGFDAPARFEVDACKLGVVTRLP